MKFNCKAITILEMMVDSTTTKRPTYPSRAIKSFPGAGRVSLSTHLSSKLSYVSSLTLGTMLWEPASGKRRKGSRFAASSLRSASRRPTVRVVLRALYLTVTFPGIKTRPLAKDTLLPEAENLSIFARAMLLRGIHDDYCQKQCLSERVWNAGRAQR